MSGGLIRRTCLAETLRDVSELDLASHLRLLIHDCPDSYLQFTYELAEAADWPRDVAVARASAVAFRHIAIELADDVCDGDCPRPIRPQLDAPVLLLVLEQLATLAALRGHVPTDCLARSARLNLSVAGGQYRELRTRTWTRGQAMEAALRLNGDQFTAHLELLWGGSPLAAEAGGIARDLGVALHVLSDRAVGDRRFAGVSPAGKAHLLSRARQAAERLAKSPIACVRGVGDAARAGLLA